jgi:methylphosphotriester-DNA--protein-cysteine methyltransferase
MLKQKLDESDWLVHFSARHKRRLYKTIFGASRKELQNIHNLHSFLDQACDFSSENPRIIQYINAEVFYDQPHLNHSFKKMTGFSPVEYFEANSILQDSLMSASYNEFFINEDRL